ncbi:MAG: ComF family protein [Actinobacteria bacterium]|nr:ComF family protein [Actinomycetota bacterium]
MRRLGNIERALDFLFGAACPGCHRGGRQVCRDCREKILQTQIQNPIEYAGGVMVAHAYQTEIRQIILAFKYRNQRAGLNFLADAIVERIAREMRRGLPQIDCVTWAPTTSRRKGERGHDHAELIAKRVAGNLRSRCVGTLTRVSSRPQTGLSREERLIGPKFVARKTHARHLLLIDDVVTTGATLNSASHALYEAGAGLVSCVAIASTLLWQSSTGSCALAKARK